MKNTQFLFCSFSDNGKLRITTSDTTRLIIYFTKMFNIDMSSFTYLRDNHVLCNSLAMYFYYKKFNEFHVGNELEINDLEKIIREIISKTKKMCKIDEIKNILYSDTKFSQYSSFNIFENKIKDLIKYDKIFFWYSGHACEKVIDNKYYYGIVLNHMIEQEKRDILIQKDINEKLIEDLIKKSNKIIKYSNDELINDFRSMASDILSEEMINKFLGFKKKFYSDDFALYLNKLKSHQRFMGFFDACHSEAIVNIDDLNTNAKIIIFAATSSDKTISDSVISCKFFPWIDEKRINFFKDRSCALAYLILSEELLSLDDTVETLENKLASIKKDKEENKLYNWLKYVKILTNMSTEEKETIKLNEFIS